MFIKGSIPGSKNSVVLIKYPAKNISRQTSVEKFNKLKAESSKVEKKTSPKSKDKPKEDSKKNETKDKPKEKVKK